MSSPLARVSLPHKGSCCWVACSYENSAFCCVCRAPSAFIPSSSQVQLVCFSRARLGRSHSLGKDTHCCSAMGVLGRNSSCGKISAGSNTLRWNWIQLATGKPRVGSWWLLRQPRSPALHLATCPFSQDVALRCVCRHCNHIQCVLFSFWFRKQLHWTSGNSSLHSRAAVFSSGHV